MDADKRDLVRRLFVIATEILEDGHPDATGGQAENLKPDSYAAKARRLAAASQDLGSVAAIILSLTARRNAR